MAIFCPGCGRPFREKKRIFFYVFYGTLSLIVTEIVIGVLLVIYWSSLFGAVIRGYRIMSEISASRSAGSEVPSAPLELVRYSFSEDGKTLAGLVNNHEDRAFPDVTIRFSLKNSAGQVVGKVEDKTPKIGPHQDWAFQCRITDPSVASATFSSLDFR
ncbi:MAG: FxLYD domain-containing protein [Candidatus Omnitrophica bacterium]|nr:FxLYD domain-containing protein [Candidatus Omnitrophota bacterium]